MRRILPLLAAVAIGALSTDSRAHSPAALDLRGLDAASAGGLEPGAGVPNFRLNDHHGLTRELYYESTARAVVLVFTSTDNPRAVQTASALRALRSRFSAADVVIWQIDANAGANRARIAAEQTLYNNDLPVLIDSAQLVASELGATHQGETFVIGNSPAAVLAYRGPLDDGDPMTLAAATQHHAANAVAAVLAARAPPQPRIPLAATTPRLDLPLAPAIDYTTVIAPIVQRRCVSCHSAGNIAPHVYARYDDLASRAASIRGAMLVKRMAPWHADPHYGVFANTAALSTDETAALHAWARAGAPRGTGVDPLPAMPGPTGGDWPLGQPDLVVTLPLQTLPATGLLEYRYLSVAVPVTSDRWLRAAVVKPGNPRVVHHALVFEGTLIDVLLNGGGLGGFFAGYVPGMQQTFFPENTGKLIRQNGQVTFQMHYTTTGQPESDQTQIGFYFAPGTPERELFTRAASSTSIAIPPGMKDYERTASFVPSATRDVMIYEMSPHMHYRGKRFRFEAVYPNGSTETLLNVPQYDFAWQSQYRLTQPKRLPAGTAIRVSGAFDNSAQNPANPDPRVTVRFGEQTNDEMFIGYVNYAELPARAANPAPVFAGNPAASGRVGEMFSYAVRATPAPTTYRATGLPAGLHLDAATGTISGIPTGPGRHAIVVHGENDAGTAAATVDLTVAARGVPVFTLQPRSTRARLGSNVTLTAAVNAAPTPVYTWYFRGGEFCNTDTPELPLTNLTAAYAGDYHLVATNAAGTTTSATATLSLEFTGLINLSARARVGTGDNVVIPGITVRGSKPKTLLIRAAGPALAAFGVDGILQNPTVSVFTAAGEKILVNDDWSQGPNLAALRAAGVAQGAFALPEGGADAAMLVALAPGSYTVQVGGNGSGAAAQGVAIVEVYEADAGPSSLVNLSCRAHVGTDADILIAGFAISGTERKRVLIRGVGPSLAALGVNGTLTNPNLTVIRQATGATVASNDNWDMALAPTFSSVGAFALTPGSGDAALIVDLEPGSYTAQVSGVNNTTGVAIVEVYELP